MSYCADCGIEFICGMAEGDKNAPCWCSSLPPLPRDGKTAAAEATGRCYCPQCLQRRLQHSRQS